MEHTNLFQEVKDFLRIHISKQWTQRSLLKIFLSNLWTWCNSPDVIPCGWLGSKHQPTTTTWWGIMLTACAELGGLNKKDLQRILEERQTTLAQQKVVFTQLQDLLHQLQELHTQSQERWLCPRYFMLKRGVNSVLAAFGSVAGLSPPSKRSPRGSTNSPQEGKGIRGSVWPIRTLHNKGKD